MTDKTLGLLGLMRKANAIAIGETNTGAAVRTGKARLLLTAADASDNAKRRAEGFAARRGLKLTPLPYTKEEISASVGVSGCSMAAVLEFGFAKALLRALADRDPDRYGEMAESFGRRRAARGSSGERNERIGKRRNSI